MTIFQEKLTDAARRVESRLDDVLHAQAAAGAPARLVAAMRHALLSGGKRFRPFLVLESAALFAVPAAAAIDAAAAIECIHCYSLVHDDLPCMDNDELRRGQPTVWKAYDEWTAVLTGDALQALAFELLSEPDCHKDPSVRAELILSLAKAAGGAGMAGGQALDLWAEHRVPRIDYNADEILALQVMKTGRLINAACDMGAILGKADDSAREALRDYSSALGYAFQISDDLLDAQGSVHLAGKATGKDAAAGKATLVSLLGINAAHQRVADLTDEAVLALKPFAPRPAALIDAALFMLNRRA